MPVLVVSDDIVQSENEVMWRPLKTALIRCYKDIWDDKGELWNENSMME